MPYETRDLNLTDPDGKGCLNFVLYTEPQRGLASSSLNAELDIEAQQTVTPHFQEWLSRLVGCEPNAMRTLVERSPSTDFGVLLMSAPSVTAPPPASDTPPTVSRE